MNGYCRQTAFPPFLLDSQRAASIAAAAASSLSPLTQLGLSQMSQFGPNFNALGSQLGQLNANEVYNLLTGCFPFYPSPTNTAHLMGRTGQNATGQQASPSAALQSSLASNSALALAQYQQQLQQQPQQQQTHPQ